MVVLVCAAIMKDLSKHLHLPITKLTHLAKITITINGKPCLFV